MASAQDIITKTDGTQVEGKVEEITETSIKYRKATNLTGPLYTIPIVSVLNIAYENGSVDLFNHPGADTPAETSQATPAPTVSTDPEQAQSVPQSSPTQSTPTPVATSSAPTDEELLRYAESIPAYKQSGTMTDSELLRLNHNINYSPKKLYSKAKTMRIVGWVGGGVLLAAGVIVCYTVGEIAYYDVERYPTLFGSAGGAAIWILGFNLYANSLKKQARELEMYSANIIENDILNFGGNKLTAGVNMMGNRMTHTHGLGLSLKFNF